MGTAKEKALRLVFSDSNRNRREQETAPDLQPEMQRAYNQFEANTKAAVRASVSGQRPEFQPQVSFNIPDDNVRDILRIADTDYDQDTRGSRSYKVPIYRLTQNPSSSSMQFPHGLNDIRARGTRKSKTKK